MKQTQLVVAAEPRRPLVGWSKLDTQPRRIIHLHAASNAELEALGVPAAEAERAIAAAARGVRSLAELGVGASAQQVLRGAVLLPHDARLFITNVAPAAGPIMSAQPFHLRVSFAASEASRPALVAVEVEWDGEPFVVEQRVDPAAAARGFVDVEFAAEQTLPVGRALFRVTLWSEAGAESRYRTMCAVLPSNPFSLDLSPAIEFVTGTNSARAIRQNDTFVTSVHQTYSNGGSSEVSLKHQFTWKFWDGGVGGNLIEQGTGDFGGTVHVPAHGTANFTTTFTSPDGSGVFDQFDNRNDLTIEIIATRTSGGDVTAHITARTMFHFGVNITRVAREDFSSNELDKLHDAATVLRHIYEKRDVTVKLDFRWIAKADAGGYRDITSDSEAGDLCDDWSGPDTNDNIDCFVCNSFSEPDGSGGCFDGVDPSVPGPASHDGDDSGVVCSKIGCGQSSIDAEYLGMLMGHELGHYLGLEHSTSTDNLMLANSSATQTKLTYDQYEIIIQHPWMKIGG